MALAARMGASELLAVDIDGVGIKPPQHHRPARPHAAQPLGPGPPCSTLTASGPPATCSWAIWTRCGCLAGWGGTAYAILPADDGFAADFAATYRAALADAAGRAPTLWLTESMARQVAGYPAVYEKDPAAPTAAGIAPLELAAERMQVPPETPMTAKMLALTFLGSFDRDPGERYPVLLGRQEGSVVGEAALAAAHPEEFITALVARTLANMGTEIFW